MNEKNIIDYIILERYKASDLSEIVKDYIKNGWTLLGYPFWSEGWASQAMVKYEETEK